MNRITFIYSFYRKLFRNHLDSLVCYVNNHSQGLSASPFMFERFLNNFYVIDNDIEFFIRNGNSSVIRGD